MIGLKVQINHQTPVLAAGDDLGVLNAILSCTGPLGPRSQVDPEKEPLDIFLTLGGLTRRGPQESEEHPRWLHQDGLGVGDRVSIEVVQVDEATPAETAFAAREQEREEREYFEHCRSIYLELRHKYESLPL
ncbi:hypothetical protein HNQ51_003728 [Inhella inkyongensis]|uniref:Uncharacterized protein n=2 Tax=Inhella inkyongensis TaxID=392593 RepID=A0A840S9S6_9BURK|nr:hypothetical protein [Inhella inkyongensis]MBB5206382.1 hypothetical protein [Inhella inkyongensis]